MARISSGFKFGLNAKQAQAARLLAEGHSTRQIALIIFNCTDDENPMVEDKRKVQNNMRKLQHWMAHPEFQECYRAIVKEIVMPDYARATRVLSKQLDNENGWLANKAANDILTRFGPSIMGEDDKSVTVRIEGLPTLGTPEPVDELPESTPIVVEGDVN